jgi:hypothetical protein
MTIGLKEMYQMCQRQWETEWEKQPFVCPPGTPIVTGDQHKDAYLYYLTTDCGVQLKFAPGASRLNIKEYTITDEQKFMWFVLRWS